MSVTLKNSITALKVAIDGLTHVSEMLRSTDAVSVDMVRQLTSMVYIIAADHNLSPCPSVIDRSVFLSMVNLDDYLGSSVTRLTFKLQEREEFLKILDSIPG